MNYELHPLKREFDELHITRSGHSTDYRSSSCITQQPLPDHNEVECNIDIDQFIDTQAHLDHLVEDTTINRYMAPFHACTVLCIKPQCFSTAAHLASTTSKTCLPPHVANKIYPDLEESQLDAFNDIFRLDSDHSDLGDSDDTTTNITCYSTTCPFLTSTTRSTGLR